MDIAVSDLSNELASKINMYFDGAVVCLAVGLFMLIAAVIVLMVRAKKNKNVVVIDEKAEE